VETTWRDYDKEPLTEKELDRLIGDRPVEDFLNPRSVPFRKMGLKGKKIGKREAIRLMRKDMNLLRRPLAVKGKRYIFGLDEEAYRKL